MTYDFNAVNVFFWLISLALFCIAVFDIDEVSRLKNKLKEIAKFKNVSIFNQALVDFGHCCCFYCYYFFVFFGWIWFWEKCSATTPKSYWMYMMS